MTDEARLKKKKKWRPKFGPKPGTKLGFFCHFIKFGLLVFLQRAGVNFGPNELKLAAKLVFFLVIFQGWFISFLGNYIG